MRLRLAELIAALSLATDLGLGLPQEHVLRQCRIALGLAERLGVDEAERASVYYVAMLAWVGCTADSHELAAQFGDEIAFRAEAHQVDLAGLPLMGFMLRRVGDGRPPLRRVELAATLVATGGRGAAEAMTAHCGSGRLRPGVGQRLRRLRAGDGRRRVDMEARAGLGSTPEAAPRCASLCVRKLACRWRLADFNSRRS